MRDARSLRTFAISLRRICFCSSLHLVCTLHLHSLLCCLAAPPLAGLPPPAACRLWLVVVVVEEVHSTAPAGCPQSALSAPFPPVPSRRPLKCLNPDAVPPWRPSFLCSAWREETRGALHCTHTVTEYNSALMDVRTFRYVHPIEPTSPMG